MTPPYVMGIDGGGSRLRAAVLARDLTILGESEGPTASPVVAGPEPAAETIRVGMRAALAAANLRPEQIAAVGIGIAGALPRYSEGWLREVVAAVLPGAIVVPSIDFEIALVGALGERQGVLVLSGTGSLAYGVNAAGEAALVGAWGYLIDDGGSGYWLGQQALQALARAADGRAPATALTRAVLDALSLSEPLDLVPWLYQPGAPRTRDVAALAPLVLAHAEGGDAVAQCIVADACADLALAARTVMRRLDLTAPRIAFAGGLLSAPNPLSSALCAALGLDSLPQPRYSPVIGAGLLALAACAP